MKTKAYKTEVDAFRNHDMKPIASPVNWLIAATVILLSAGCASTGTKGQATPAAGDHPEPGKGLVIFYRENHFTAGGLGYAIRDVDEKRPNTPPRKAFTQPRIGALPNGSYFVYQAAPGEHIFAGSDIEVWHFGVGSQESDTYLYCLVNIESNKTYYVRVDFVGRPRGAMPSVRVVSSQQGSEAIKSLKRVTLK